MLGAVQGVVLAVALASKRSNRVANRLLAAMMASFSIFLATSVYYAGRFEQQYPHFFGFGYPQPFLFGPLVYLYAVTAADRTRRLGLRDALHFVPFVASVLIGLPIYLSSGAEKIAMYAQFSQGNLPLHLVVQDRLKLVSGVVYAVATMVFLLKHREQVKASYSSTERVNLQWLLWLGGAAAFIWAMAVTFQLLEAAGVASVARPDDFVSLAMSILVYSIGYRGMKQPEIFKYETAEFPIPVMPPAARAAESPTAEAKYERSGLSDRQAGKLKDALLALMENERPWQDSELTLADLATRLDTTPHKLSEVLNTEVGQTFYDFVNGYRVREVQRRIDAGEAKTLKILTLALDAGFASKSTFNNVFKKHTNLTPSDYRQAAGA